MDAPRGAIEGAMNVQLLERLDAASRYRVVPVVGPAGAGKTGAIAFASAGSPLPFAHFRARAYHANLVPFVRALVDELATTAPLLSAGFASAAAAAKRSTNAAQALGIWFGERLGDGHRIVALDDLHAIAPSHDANGGIPVRDFIVAAVGASHPNVRFVLGARQTIAWPMALWLADGSTCMPISVAEEETQRDDRVREAARFAAWLTELAADDAPAMRALALLPALDSRYVARMPGASSLMRTIAIDFPRARSGDRFAAEFASALAAIGPGEDRLASDLACDAVGCAEAPLRLAFYTERDARSRIVEALDREGFELLEAAYGDVVHEAIEHLSVDERRQSALALSLEAKQEMERGRHDVGESWYLHAAKLAATPQARARIEHAHGADLLRRSRSDAVDLLERAVACPVTPGFDALSAATLGGAYAANDRWDEARSAMRTALAAVGAWGAFEYVAIRAVVYRQAAYVFLRDGKPSQAAVFGRRAIESARICGADEIVASTLSVLVVVALSYEDDGEAAISLLRELERCAERLQNAFLLRYSRLALLDAFGEAANWTEVDRIERLLSSQELENDARHTEETLVRIRALRYAASGNYAHAARLLQTAIESESEPDLIGLRHAEVAAYAAAAGDAATSRQAIAAADAAIAGVPADTTLVVRAILSLALAEFLAGERTRARRRMRDATLASGPFPRMRTLRDAMSCIIAYSRREARAGDTAVLEALGSLHACGLGGIASVLGALPFSSIVRPAS